MGRRKAGWHYYWKRELPPEIEKVKHREFYLKKGWERPQINATNFRYAIRKLVVEYDIQESFIAYALLFDKYEFFTQKHLVKLNLEHKEPKSLRRYIKLVVSELYAKGLVYHIIRSWELDDEEYKQRFGNDKNRHNYHRRYKLTMAGELLVDKFYKYIEEKPQ